MGVATLGRPGDTVTFRIDPDEVKWNWKVNTSVQDTVGGRVVQIVGCTLSDLTINGHYGENHSKHGSAANDYGPGRSWVMAEQFIRRVRNWMDYQTRHPNYYSQTPVDEQSVNPYLRFTYPTYGWDFNVYVKAISDEGGNVIEHKPGKFSYTYSLTLFIIEENSASLHVLRGQAARAAESFMERIARGLGWEHYDPKTGQFDEHTYSGYDPRYDKTIALADWQSIQNPDGPSATGGASNPGQSGDPTTPAGNLSAVDIARVAHVAGFRGSGGAGGDSLIWAVAVALAESGGDPQAINKNTNGTVDRGLWQINSVHTQYDESQLFDPDYNAQAAWDISGHGSNWNPWYTYKPPGDSVGGGPSTPAGKQYDRAKKGVESFLAGNTGTTPAHTATNVSGAV